MFHDEPPIPRREVEGIPWGSDEPAPPVPGGAPPESPGAGRWRRSDVLAGIALLMAGYVGLILAFALVALIVGFEEPADALSLETAAVLLAFELWIAAIVLWLARRRRISLRGLGFVSPRRWGTLPLAVIGAYAAVAVWVATVELLDRTLDVDLGDLAEGNPLPDGDYGVGLWVLLGLGVVVAAPIAEELFFRGLLFRALDTVWPTFLAMLVSGFAFALVHLNPSVIVPFTLIGIVFAWAYQRSGSLWTPIGAHAIVNGISFALAVAGVEA